jgi:hypothetical protein
VGTYVTSERNLVPERPPTAAAPVAGRVDTRLSAWYRALSVRLSHYPIMCVGLVYLSFIPALQRC